MAKLSEILPELVGDNANIVVPRLFAKLMTGLDGGAVLAHLVWWHAHKADEEGWFYRTDGAISKQLEVKPYAVQKARKLSIELGFMKTALRGMPAKTHYQIDLETLAKLLLKLDSRKHETRFTKTRNKFVENGKLSIKGLNKELNKEKGLTEIDTNGLVKAYGQLLGYPIPSWGQEAQAAKWLLTHGNPRYTQAEVLACYEALKSESFWQEKHLSLQSIKKQIGPWRRKFAKKPRDYTPLTDAEMLACQEVDGD